MKSSEHVQFTKRVAVLVCRLAAASNRARHSGEERQQVEAELCRLVGEQTARGLATALLYAQPRCFSCGGSLQEGDDNQCLECACSATLAWEE